LRVPGLFLSRASGHLTPDLRRAHVSLFGGNLPRAASWLPYVFTSPEEAAESGVSVVNHLRCVQEIPYVRDILRDPRSEERPAL
jgi:hypothetical protein